MESKIEFNNSSDTMGNIILMFPGQGSQYIGMGSDFLKKNSGYKKYFKIASDIAGFDLLDIIENKNDTGEFLDRTQYSQVSIYTLSCAVNDHLFKGSPQKHRLIKTAIGHSLGDYSALYSCGAFDFEQGARLVAFRGKVMEEAGSMAVSGQAKKMMMAAILGSDIDMITSVLKNYKESVFIANINDFSQIVISGYSDDLLKAAEKIKELGAKKVIPLKVNIASHCPIMSGAAKRLEEYLSKNFINFNALSRGFFSSTEVKHIEPQDISSVLVKQLLGPVRWVDSVQSLASKLPQDGSIKAFVEIGPGKVLSGLVKRILSKIGREDILTFNTDSPEEIENIDSGRMNI